QILEEQDFKEEDFGLFQLAGQKCIDEGHVDQLIEIIQNEQNKVIIKNMGWNLVGPVVRCLLWNKEDNKRKRYSLMLDLLVKLCNPKELLLGLLELIEEPSGKQISQIILLLLQPLQTVTHFLCLSCFKSLKCPLLTAQFLDQSEETGTDPLRCFASEIIGFLSAIGYPLPKMIFNHGKKKKTWNYLEFEEEEDKQLADSMASLAYLVFVQGISIDQLPMVLRTEESVFSKGLDLLENGLLRIEDNSLLHQYLEIKSFLSVPQGLVKIMTLCPIETLVCKCFRTKIMASLNLLRYLIIKDNENDNQVLHSALYTFDLIESVLARVEELIEIKTKSTSEENIGIK
ncbi:Glomulin, partial [Galemys pyrenaicus]